jgi:hypothetical protein
VLFYETVAIFVDCLKITLFAEAQTWEVKKLLFLPQDIVDSRFLPQDIVDSGFLDNLF